LIHVGNYRASDLRESPFVSKDLNPEKALIFRITHRNNIPWILDRGLHCPSSKTLDPNYVNIGNTDLIARRTSCAATAGWDIE
jgi:hypothetical protein